MSTQCEPRENPERTRKEPKVPTTGDKISRTLRFSETAYASGLKLAALENRSFNNLVEVLILRAGGKIVEGPHGGAK